MVFQISNFRWKYVATMAVSGLSIALVLLGTSNTRATEQAAYKDVTFTDEFLQSPDNIATGKAIWDEQCKLCHGKTAYPGKAPRLKPSKYKPNFVYKRVTKGFRGMPSWAEIYDEHERMSVTAFIMSKEFSN